MMGANNDKNALPVGRDVRPRGKNHDITGKEIDGISDLVVWAPIKEGFIDAFNNVTFESRLRLVAEALHDLRKSAREHEHLEPYADTAKRILSLLDFRIGVVDKALAGEEVDPDTGEPTLRPRKYMYLVATFDGPWEPYMRLIYDPLGPFLDLVLCNCEGYEPATHSTFETYAKWVRDNQLDSAIFYSTSGLTVNDKIYLSELERIQRSRAGDDADHEIARLSRKTPDDAARDVQFSEPNKSLSLGLEALNALYKLTDLYPPNTPDGFFLASATRDLLRGLEELLPLLDLPEFGALKASLKLPLDWYNRIWMEPDPYKENPAPVRSEIQKGILSSYDDDDFTVTHGALLFIKIENVDLFRRFLKTFPFSWEEDGAVSIPSTGFDFPVYSNIAFSHEGLKRLGVPGSELGKFPKEFRQGMAERAMLIGDKFHNHPRRWRLPERNWPRGTEASAPPIELNEIDVVLQLRSSLSGAEEPEKFVDFGTVASNLLDSFREKFDVEGLFETEDTSDLSLDKLLAGSPDGAQSNIDALIAAFDILSDRIGVRILGTESMFRPEAFSDDGASKPRSAFPKANVDHFGFLDGISQPIPHESTSLPSDASPMDMLLGDLLYGYSNTRRDFHDSSQKDSLMFNGSFLVVRKIAQDVGGMRDFETTYGPDASALLVGRKKDGEPLVSLEDTSNTFDYDQDPAGEKCPLSSHIRLANPRSEFHGRRDPKILRRGMTYGEPFDKAPHHERGIMFMAYCASISEQYEVIQRWLNGANSTGVSSSRNDPLTGARPRSEDGRDTFSCLVNGRTTRFDIPRPFVTLEWGSYFFVPSKTALRRIATAPEDKQYADIRAESEDAREAFGRRTVEDLDRWRPKVRQEEWKRIIEDFLTKDPTEHDVTPQVWQAIDAMGGVYKVDSGIAFDRGVEHEDPSAPRPKEAQPVILVTDKDKIFEVLGQDKDPCTPSPFSSNEQLSRINEGFGTIYVCLDEGEDYDDEAYDTNKILLGYDREFAFNSGYKAGTRVLAQARGLAERLGQGAFKLELSRQFIQPALAELCADWYGIPDGNFIKGGPWDWDDGRQHPVCPGDFLAPSRHAFYPRPTNRIAEFGKDHGKRMKREGMNYVKSVWDRDTGTNPIKGPISNKLLKVMQLKDQADPGRADFYQDLFLRTMIGSMVGAIPPMDGCLRWITFDWLKEKSLWHIQDEYRLARQSCSEAGHYAAARQSIESPLRSAMCVRPAPDLLYRTVTADGVEIGGLPVDKGDLVILCLSAATQKELREGSNDVSVVFGGNRKAEDGTPIPGHGLHACPAQDLAMGGMMGIMAALLDVGRVQALPASLIVEVSGWD